ncbi:MAG: HTH domain-containing protein, partial [Gammaproteobacteria bacterium]|nr:HTH domain-containing protein [Gammaproteobacteria bacterium]
MELATLPQVKAIHHLLTYSRYPVSRSKLMTELECSDSTIGRIISSMKQAHGAPIEFDRKQQGYYYNNKNGDSFELPGLWFNESELYALLVSQKLLLDVHPGLFNDHIQPLLAKIEHILHNSQHHPEQISSKVKILHQAHRQIDDHTFQKLATGLMENRKL